VKFRPGDTDGLSTVFVTDNSALPAPTAGVTGGLVLLPGVGSGVELAIAATFGRSLPSPV
jgi:hypothetical protein